MDVCIHGMCKRKKESNKKMEKIRVLAISPIWAPLSSSPKFRKEKEKDGENKSTGNKSERAPLSSSPK